LSDHTPIIVIELLLVLGGALGFGWWQLRELKKLRQDREQREREQNDAKPEHEDDPREFVQTHRKH
jgi:hypothetical protein